jgi:hypothetical protein
MLVIGKPPLSATASGARSWIVASAIFRLIDRDIGIFPPIPPRAARTAHVHQVLFSSSARMAF